MPEVNLLEIELKARAALFDRIQHLAQLSDNSSEVLMLAEAFAHVAGQAIPRGASGPRAATSG